MRRSSDAPKFCLELLKGFWPLTDVNVDAWAVAVPPPMINAPGAFRPGPLRKMRLSGNGSAGFAYWPAHARDHPKFAVFTRVGEKICVCKSRRAIPGQPHLSQWTRPKGPGRVD